jgi:hypothetical protein
LYYNLCLCKSFKERAPDGACLTQLRSAGGALVSFAGAKVRLFCKLPKYSASFFIKKAFFTPYTYYIIYAREEKGREKEDGRRKAREGEGRREEEGRRKAREGEGAIKSHHTERKDEGEIRAGASRISTRRFGDKHGALPG